MTVALDGKKIRLKLNVASHGSIFDVYENETPKIWHGNDCRIELGIFLDDEVVSLANIASLKMEIRASSREGSPLVAVTLAAVDLYAGLTAGEWDAGTHQHAVIDLTAAQTSLDMSTGVSTFKKPFWMVFSVLTTDSPAKEFTLAGTVFEVEIDGTGGTYTPPSPAETYYTREESDARYNMPSGMSWERDGDEVWLVLDGVRKAKVSGP